MRGKGVPVAWSGNCSGTGCTVGRPVGAEKKGENEFKNNIKII
jgi:hypothetical protein